MLTKMALMSLVLAFVAAPMSLANEGDECVDGGAMSAETVDVRSVAPIVSICEVRATEPSRETETRTEKTTINDTMCEYTTTTYERTCQKICWRCLGEHGVDFPCSPKLCGSWSDTGSSSFTALCVTQ